MQARTISYPLFVSPISALVAALFVLIGLLSASIFYTALQRPTRARCHHPVESAPGTLRCALDGMPERDLIALPKVKTRRQGRNSYNDASLQFADGSVTTAEIAMSDTEPLNRTIEAAAAGGPAVELPLATGRWIGALMVFLPIGLVLLMHWRAQPRRVEISIEPGPVATWLVSTTSRTGERLCGPISVARGARVHVVRSDRPSRACVFVDETPLLPRPAVDHPAHDRVARELSDALA